LKLKTISFGDNTGRQQQKKLGVCMLRPFKLRTSILNNPFILKFHQDTKM